MNFNYRFPPPTNLKCKLMHLRFSLTTRLRLFEFTNNVTHYPSQKQKTDLSIECNLSKIQVWYLI